MILVHRLRGEPLFVNADLIETVEATPDTTLVLVDGRRIHVIEPPGQIVDRVVAFRASLLLAADAQRAAGPGTPLSIVPDEV